MEEEDKDSSRALNINTPAFSAAGFTPMNGVIKPKRAGKTALDKSNASKKKLE